MVCWDGSCCRKYHWCCGVQGRVIVADCVSSDIECFFTYSTALAVCRPRRGRSMLPGLSGLGRASDSCFSTTVNLMWLVE